MSVVVTGAAGFIGRHVTASLLARGHRVVGIDRRRWTPAPGASAVVADLADASDAVDAALASADAVVHLAGCPGVRDPRPDVAHRRHRDNVLAGARVLARTPAGTTMVVASSSSVYGGSRDGRPSHEDDRPAPRGGYARSKALLEALCGRRRAAGGHVAVVRPFTVAGEGQRPDMAVARWLEAARTGAPVTVLGGLDRVRDVTDVRDVAEGIARTLERGHATTLNLGTGRTHRLGDLVAAVAAATATALDVRVAPAADVEVPATRADTRRCRRLLDFVPTTSLPDLVARQLAATAPTDDARLEVV
jgi:nucleoside-diphosphate-sugar epimerase